MADIFISYSKPDRFEVEKLAAMLEAEGWSVWWDKGLTAGDQYRDEIMKELARARAVVAVWTPNSIKSDWVRAEAGQAKANAKLIPVKADGVGYGDIPLPFGEMHTEPIANTAQIRAAIVAQLEKPQAQPSGIWMATAELRYAFLTWFGIIGGAITLFSSLKGLITLADWAKVLVDHWHEWTHAFWSWLPEKFGIRIPPLVSLIVTYLVFVGSVVVGLLRRNFRRISNGMSYRLDAELLKNAVFILVYWYWVVPLAVEVSVARFGMSFEAAMLVSYAVFAMGSAIALATKNQDHMPAFLCSILLSVLCFVMLLEPSQGLIADVRERADEYLQPSQFERISSELPVFFLLFLPWLCLLLVPAKDLNRRLFFVIIGLVILVGLNYLAKSPAMAVFRSAQLF